MTRNRVDRVLMQADLYYKAFPTDKETINHNIIKQVVQIIKRIMEYRGATKGAGALPKSLLEMRYNEMYTKLQELREQVNRADNAYKEALKALSDAEELLDHIFV